MEKPFRLTVNGVPREVRGDPERSLLDVLREELQLTGTKRGCDIGVCGSCTVLVDGTTQRACKLRLREVEGTCVETIEGLERDGALHPLQQAFIDCGAIQCGFCTPGMIMAAKALLDANPKPSREEIKRALAPNLCRCTGYQQIFEAIEEAARRLRKER